MAKKIDWTVLETEYVTTNISYRKLAEKHGVSFNTLKDRAIKHGWKQKRDKAADKKVRDVSKKLIRSKATEAVNQLMTLADSTDLVAALIKRILEDQEQFQRHIVTEADGDGGSYVTERMFDKFDIRALKDFTTILKDMVIITRNLYGLPTFTEKEALEMARQKLELDKRRLELDAQKADIFDKSNAIEVVFTDGEDTDGTPIDGSEASG